MEEEVEGWPQFAADVSVIGDKDPDEHRLVDLAAKLRPGFVIGAAEVGNEGEGGFEVPFDDVEFELKGAEPFLNDVEFASDAVLLGLQEVEGDRAGVVGFETFGAFCKGAALPRDELLSFDACVLAELSRARRSNISNRFY